MQPPATCPPTICPMTTQVLKCSILKYSGGKSLLLDPPLLENLFQDGTTELLWGSSNIMKVKDIASLFVYCEFHHICGQLQDKFGFGQFWQKVKIWGSLFGTTSKLWPIFFLKAQLKVCFKLPLVNPGFQHARSERPICSLLNRIAVEFTILFAGQLQRIN